MLRFFAIVFFLTGFTLKAFSQCSVVVPSSNGYSVTVKVNLVSVIPSSTSCPYGYNYNLALTYTITFTGSNIPSSLYTLQGNFTCNGQSLFYDLPNNGGTGSYTTTTNPYISSDGTNVYTSHPGCTAANPTNLNCGTITVDINGPGINNQTVNCAMSTLPVGLALFSGTYTREGIALSWKTLSEKNNDFFTVQKSQDGLEWTNLSDIRGAGTSQLINSYAFLDEKPSEGITYYRLKQTDFDQTYTYSSVISVLNAKDHIYCTKLWPNPTTGDINFNLTTPQDGQLSYKILTEIGREAKNGTVDFFKGKNEMNFSISDLPCGSYVLELDPGNGTREYRKIIKLN